MWIVCSEPSTAEVEQNSGQNERQAALWRWFRPLTIDSLVLDIEDFIFDQLDWYWARPSGDSQDGGDEDLLRVSLHQVGFHGHPAHIHGETESVNV